MIPAKTSLVMLAVILAGTCHAVTPDAQDMAKLAGGNNEFASDLYGKLKAKEGNLFFSPYSISTAIGMTYLGARTETENQIARTMHFELGQDRLHPAMADLQARLGSPEHQWKTYELNIANAMWVQDGYKLQGDFVKAVGTYYTGGLDKVDFLKPQEATDRINGWVERQTKDRIKKLFDPRMITKDTRLVLVNAIYFKGLWDTPFDKNLTRDGDFHVTSDKTIKAKMMHMTGQFMVGGDSEKQILMLPYVGGDFRDDLKPKPAVGTSINSDLSMLIFLPKGQDGLDKAADWLKPGVIESLLVNFAGRTEAEIAIPRFTMTSGFELSQTLSDMGMTDAFTSKADFSGMDGSRNLMISHVIHKAFVEVNEDGTEAAAATGVGMALTAAPMKREPVKFIADHPFMFVIRDNKTHSTLFVGRVVNPAAGSDVK
jgi:serpin B